MIFFQSFTSKKIECDLLRQLKFENSQFLGKWFVHDWHSKQRLIGIQEQIFFFKSDISKFSILSISRKYFNY
jgi:hypothetical protein